MTTQDRCDWCGAAFGHDAIDAIHADTGDGRVIHFCGVLCMNACVEYSAALTNGRAVHPANVLNTRQ
jgi:hypothetical protein